jgi:hypothetical protein
VPGAQEDACDVVDVHVIPPDVAFEKLDATVVLEELEEARRDARVVRLVTLARPEDVEEAKAYDLTLQALEVRLHPAVEHELRVAVGVERPLARGVVHPAEPAFAIQGGGGGVDHRNAAKLPELQPFSRVLKVVTQHLGDVRLEHVGPRPQVEDDVERRKTPIEGLDVEGVERHVVEEIAAAEVEGSPELLGPSGKRVHQDHAVTPSTVERSDQP